MLRKLALLLGLTWAVAAFAQPTHRAYSNPGAPGRGGGACPYPVDGGCSGAPLGTGTRSGPFYRDTNLIADAKQSGQGEYFSAPGTVSAHPPDWNLPGGDYGVGVPPATSLQDPAAASYTGCSYAATGAPVTNGPKLSCSGANPVIDGVDLSSHNGVFVEFSSATGICLIKNSKFGAGANGVTWGSSMLYLPKGNSCNVDIESSFFDLQYPSIKYLADFIQNNSTGILTINRSAFLNAAGRWIEQNSTGNVTVTNSLAINYGQTTCCGHGEFLIIDVSGSPAIGAQTYTNFVSVLGSATPQNEFSSPIYTPSGTGTPTYGSIALTNILAINNDNAADSSLPTTEASVATIQQSEGNVALRNIMTDPTGALYCFINSGNPVVSWSGVVDLIDGSTVNTFGVCAGVHP